MSVIILSLLIATLAPTDASLLALKIANKRTAIAQNEPFFATIVTRAKHLKTLSDRYAHRSLDVRQTPEFTAYLNEVDALAAADLKGHLDLKARGTDRDLKCILKGLSLDVPLKQNLILKAQNDGQFKDALGQMSSLLEDHIEILTTPATVDSGLDCTIEFGNG